MGFCVCGAGLLTLGFLQDPALGIAVLFVTMASTSCTSASGLVIPLDIAPRFSSFMSGVFVTTGTVAAMPAPVLVSMMTEQGSLDQWRNVFILLASVIIASSIFFFFTCDANLQTWAVPPHSSPVEAPGNPLTPDPLTLTVMSEGTPITPRGTQNRFEFRVSFKRNFNAATLNSKPTTPVANNSTSVSTLAPATEDDTSENHSSTEHGISASQTHTNKQVTHSATSTSAVPVSGSTFVNVAFEPDSTTTNQNKSNKHVTKPAPIFETSTGQSRRKSSDTATKRPKLKLKMLKSKPVSFDATEMCVNLKDINTDGNMSSRGFGEVEKLPTDLTAKIRTLDDKITEQTKL